MRVSWRNLDWVGEADRGAIEKKLAEIGGDGSALLDRVDLLARPPAQPGAPFEVRITGNVAKNQITAVRREASAEAAFKAALDAFERSALSVWSARAAVPIPVVAALPAVRLPLAPEQQHADALVSRWRPDLSLPRLHLSLDPQALLERLAQPTRGAWRAASSLMQLSLGRALSRQAERNRDRDRAEALEKMSWRERLAALAMWNEVEVAERWAREQVFARRWRSELARIEQGEEQRSDAGPAGWRERLADLSLWNELEAAERWAREQVLARLRRGERGLPDLTSRALPELIQASRADASRGWRSRLADLSLWDTLESFERRMRRQQPRALPARRVPASVGLFAQLSRRFEVGRERVRRGGESAVHLLRVPLSVRVGASIGVAAVVGLSSFQGASYTETADAQLLGASAYSAVAVPESWPRSEAPFSAVAVPLSWERDRAPFSALAAPLGSSQLANVDAAFSAIALPVRAMDGAVAYSAVALPEALPSVAAGSVAFDDRAALRD